jgi:hypothetical protein
MHANETSAPDPYLDRRAAAAVITATLFPISERKLRDWAEPATVVVAGRACARRSAWMAEAQRRLDVALYRRSDGRADAARRMANARAARTAA